MRRAAKVDLNQQAIVDRLRECCVWVEIIGKPLDLIVWARGKAAFMEVKNPDGKDQLTKAQVEFIARCPMPIHIVRTPDEAVRAVLGEKVMT